MGIDPKPSDNKSEESPQSRLFKRFADGETIYGREQLAILQPCVLEAERLCRDFNALPGDSLKKTEVLSDLFKKKVPDSVIIKPPFTCDYGFNITIEENVFINYGAVFLDTCAIHIGADTIIGPGVHMYAVSHPIDVGGRVRYGCSGKPITIGSTVWIGGGSIILPGVSIGDFSIVGAGSVVTKDIPSRTVVAGNPAKPIKTI